MRVDLSKVAITKQAEWSGTMETSMRAAGERTGCRAGGIFKHHDGFVLKGSFKANFFIDESNVLRNPQMSEK